MVNVLSETHHRRMHFINKQDYIKEVLEHGAKRARVVAQQTMQEVKQAMKMW